MRASHDEVLRAWPEAPRPTADPHAAMIPHRDERIAPVEGLRMSPIVTWWIGLAAFSRSNCVRSVSAVVVQAGDPRRSRPAGSSSATSQVASIWHEMDIPERVEAYLASQPEPKQTDLRQLHALMLAEFPECRL